MAANHRCIVVVVSRQQDGSHSVALQGYKYNELADDDDKLDFIDAVAITLTTAIEGAIDMCHRVIESTDPKSVTIVPSQNTEIPK